MSYEDEIWESRQKPVSSVSRRDWEEMFLVTAMAQNDWKQIDRFLGQKDPASLPYVMKAVKHGYLKLAAWFVEQGEPVDAVDIDGRTALHWAAVRRETEKVRTLIRLGADVNKIDLWQETPLMKACIGGPVPDNRPVVTLLLAAGANPSIAGMKGHTVFDYESCPATLIRHHAPGYFPESQRQR